MIDLQISCLTNQVRRLLNRDVAVLLLWATRERRIERHTAPNLANSTVFVVCEVHTETDLSHRNEALFGSVAGRKHLLGAMCSLGLLHQSKQCYLFPSSVSCR